MRTITWKPRERKALDGDGEIAILEGFASFFFFLFFSPLLFCRCADWTSRRALELDRILEHGTRTAGSWKKPLASLKEKYITAIYSWVAVACKKKKKKKKRERERATTPWVKLQDFPSCRKKKKKKKKKRERNEHTTPRVISKQCPTCKKKKKKKKKHVSNFVNFLKNASPVE